MGVRDRIALAEQRADAAEANLELVAEGIAELELALEDRGWERLLAGAVQEFSLDGLKRASALAAVMAVSHPLIKRGLALRAAYVWGKGVQITARANGDEGAQDVNKVIQAFLDDRGNRKAFTGAQARQRLERTLGTDGQVCALFFTNPRTGAVRVRTFPFAEMADVFTNPQDRTDVWFIKRIWTSQTIDPASGMPVTTREARWYPALGYRPLTMPSVIGGIPVERDVPILHIRANELEGWVYGIGDAYAALPWARAYRDILTDWVTLFRALSQFAFRLSTKGSKAQQARRALAARQQAPAPAANADRAGATAVLTEGDTLEAIPKTGATIDADSGRPVAAMIAASLGVPVTMLLTDPGVTGARATAETLDEPTENEMNGRRDLWGEVYRDICEHVIWAAVRAPQGPLKGSIVRDPLDNRDVVTLDGDEDESDHTIEITWPDLTQTPVNVLIAAIAEADATGKMPPVETLKLLLRALGVDDIDEIIEKMLDDQGNFIDPKATAGQSAADAFRRGQDPAAVVGDQSGQDQPDPADAEA